MKQVLNYNIYNILKFQIMRDKTYSFKDLINLRFSTFQVNEIDKPDIVLNIEKFSPTNKGCYLIDRKYYVKENYFYCKDSEGKASWEVEIKGLEQNETVINFNVCNHLSLYSLVNPNFLPQMLLMRMIEYKLCWKGCFLIHSAGICQDGEAYLLCGRGSSFKTTLCMDFVRKAGFSLLGDDRVILRGNQVFAFIADTSSPQLLQFQIEHLPTENAWTFLRRFVYLYYMFKNKHLVASTSNIASTAQLGAVFFIVRGGKEVKLEAISNSKHDQIITSLVANNRLEEFTRLKNYKINSAPFLRYMQTYTFVFPNSFLANYEESLCAGLKSILKGKPMFQLQIPEEYHPEIFSKVYQLITSAVKKRWKEKR